MSGLKIPHFGLQRQYKNLSTELIEATHKVLSTGQLVGGSYTREFEEWLRHRCNTKYAVTVHSGTQALEIIARYKKKVHESKMYGNPKVRIPNITYPATLNAFLNAGYDVVLGDTNKYGILQFNGTESGVYDCLVGLYGMQPWDFARIETAFNIIVDGAQHWLESNGQVGSGMAISFDPTKNLPSSGNGGAIVTNDINLYTFACDYKDNFKTDFSDIGTNSKMSELDCAHILVRSKYINAWQKRRKDISNYWCERLRHLPINCLSDTNVPHAHQKFVIFTSDRNVLHTHLIVNGIQSKFHYEYVLGDLTISKNLSKPDMLSTSVMLSRGVLSLPIFPELEDIEIDYIADKVIDFYEGR